MCKCLAYLEIRLKYFLLFHKNFKTYKMDEYKQFHNIIKSDISIYLLSVRNISELWNTMKLYCKFSSRFGYFLSTVNKIHLK